MVCTIVVFEYFNKITTSLALFVENPIFFFLLVGYINKKKEGVQ